MYPFSAGTCLFIVSVTQYVHVTASNSNK